MIRAETFTQKERDVHNNIVRFALTFQSGKCILINVRDSITFQF